MNSKILLSGISILSALTLMGGATFAFFSDAGKSSNNTFSTGTVDLKLTDNNEIDQDNVQASFGSTSPLSPGQCLSPQTLNLKNSGTIAANHVDIAATNTNDSFAQYLRVDQLSYDPGSGAVNLLPSLTSTNGTSIKDLQDLASSSVFTNLSLADTGVDHPLTMKVCLDESAPNSVQAATDTMDMSIVLHQSPHGSD